jgi:predicted metalloendopeptidase
VDSKNPDGYKIQLGAGKIGLPSKEYYNKPAVLANYTRTIAEMFKIMAYSNQNLVNTKLAKDIVELETKLSKASADPDKLRDISVSCPNYFVLLSPSVRTKVNISTGITQ